MKKVKKLNGEVILEMLTDDLVIIEEKGKAYVAELVCNIRNNKIVRFSFRQVSKQKYDEIGEFQNGIAIVVLDNKHGLINEKGEEICELKYSTMRTWKNKLFLATFNHCAGIININGKEVCPFIYYNILSLQKGSTCSNKVDGKLIWGIIDENGKVICEPKYDKVEYCGNGIYWTILNGVVEYINEQGQKVQGPVFDKIYGFYGKFAVVANDNGYGVINKNKEIVVIPQYKGIAPFINQEGGYTGENFVIPSGFVVLDKWGNYKSIDHKGCIRQYLNNYEHAMSWIR